MSFFQHPLAVVESSSIGRNIRIWAFAHILPGARIGCECNICDHIFIEIVTPPREAGMSATMIKGVTLHRLPRVDDLRGNLSFAEENLHILKRYFLVFDVSSRQVRGEHAHRTLHQYDAGDCIRNYGEFLALRKNMG